MKKSADPHIRHIQVGHRDTDTAPSNLMAHGVRKGIAGEGGRRSLLGAALTLELVQDPE